jgi:hypothetical protein
MARRVAQQGERMCLGANRRAVRAHHGATTGQNVVFHIQSFATRVSNQATTTRNAVSIGCRLFFDPLTQAMRLAPPRAARLFRLRPLAPRRPRSALLRDRGPKAPTARRPRRRQSPVLHGRPNADRIGPATRIEMGDPEITNAATAGVLGGRRVLCAMRVGLPTWPPAAHCRPPLAGRGP